MACILDTTALPPPFPSFVTACACFEAYPLKTPPGALLILLQSRKSTNKVSSKPSVTPMPRYAPPPDSIICEEAPVLRFGLRSPSTEGEGEKEGEGG